MLPRQSIGFNGRWGGRKFDFLFVDGDHSYDGVVSDFVAYYPLVRPGGLIALHDIVPDEMVRFGERSLNSECYGGEVYLLWRRLLERFPHRELVANWDQIGCGIGASRSPKTPHSTMRGYGH